MKPLKKIGKQNMDRKMKMGHQIKAMQLMMRGHEVPPLKKQTGQRPFGP